MNGKIKYFIISLIVCALCIPTALNATGNTVFSQGNRTIMNERSIMVPASSVLIKLWDEQLDTGAEVPFYSISLDGGKTIARTVQPSYELGLRYARFDPLNGEPAIIPLLAASDDTHLYIVQFFTQPLEEFQEAITTYGGIVRHYIAQYAYLVEMTGSVRTEVETLPYVRWIGMYHPAYRLEEFMLDNLENAYQRYPLKQYNIQVLSVEQKTAVSERIRSIGGLVNKADAGKFLIEATLTPDQLFQMIRWDEVLFVDRWSPYEADMDIAREIGGANYIESVAGYNGSGVRGEVFDAGFNLVHVDFQSRPLIPHGSVGSDYHGASTSGIVFGDGTGNPQARGMLPAGQGIVGDYNYIGLEGTNRYIHTGELGQDPYYGVFETSSVGSDRTTEYTTISADTDSALFDFDVLHCQSQSNAGDQMSRPQAWAKNIVSGGAVYHQDTLTKTDDEWNYGASIGPATDGRIKPDLCSFYDWIFTTTGGSPTAYTDNFGGTSGATPIIAGHFGLFYQMWSDGIFGNDVDPDGTVFENRPHMTTAKAMMINTAEQYPFNGTSEDLTRMHQGWGMPSLKNMYDLRDNFYIINEEDVLENLEVSTHIVAVESGSPYLKVTMTYADPAGNPGVPTQHRINDLTLKVISPSDVEYWGNYGLKTGVWSQPDGTPDTKDTVECVFIQNPEVGSWTIQVKADEVIQDSHVETPELDADYALVVSPVLSGPFPPTVNGSTQGDVGRQMDFTFVTTDPGNSNIYYWVEWGDGDHTEWFGPSASGTPVIISHTWSEQGNYSITAKAKNLLGTESGWSEPFDLTIIAPQLEIGMVSGGLFKIKTVIKNTGAIDITKVQWNITLSGNVFLGKQTGGSLLSIAPGGERTISSDFILGFGRTVITVSATHPYSSATITQNATVLLFYIKV
ncbi:MAG TPA: S8 family serine peptidase [Thermoplasmata archaeon]|nr:S8 family serine peptidase [Thermoplasmata archaeon]